jgi:hypothetical protein
MRRDEFEDLTALSRRRRGAKFAPPTAGVETKSTPDDAIASANAHYSG